ncbi:MAG: CDP-glycerol glycerophosphotransferase family protein [Selenomonadaceae bacterium]|nr:CDP-glycerol glycerophosphotransferase family protein [Selenomonadaceae bacterium]
MDKLPVIIIELDPDRIERVLSSLNFNAATVAAMLVDRGDQRSIEVGDATIPTYPLTSIEDFLIRKTDFVWLLDGEGSLAQLKNFLIENGIPEEFIVEFNARLDGRWLNSVRSIGDQNFFATGDQSILNGIDLNCFIDVKGINLADHRQDLRQSFFTARYVFDHNKLIAFALIGLNPQSLFVENPDNAQYSLVLNIDDQSVQGQLIKQLLSPNFDPSVEPSDHEDFSSKALETWQDTLNEITVETRADVFNRNLDRLEDYLKLCRKQGVKAIGVALPYAPIIRQKYSADQLTIFREAMRQLETAYDFMMIDLFDVPLGYDCFADMLNLNPRGAQLVSSLIAFKLHNRGVLPFDALTKMNYDKFFGLSALLMMDSYNKLLSRVFGVTIERLRRREKIKVGFVLYDASMWCGDDLYRQFEQSDRYEPTVFLCRRRDLDDEFVQRDFEDGLKIFEAKGINAVDGENVSDRQDVMIYLTPYTDILPPHLQLEQQTAETLTIYIPYGMHISGNAHVPLPDYPIMTLAWKVFLDTRETLAFYDRSCRLGLPRGYYSGYPRMDYFYSEHPDDQFKWKEARPHSTRIIYAPHWSLDNGIQYSTFHLNCKFVYEYAKSHPKTSWVFKPHPNLAYSAVSSGLFRSLDDYNEYVRKWERLPNARVATGGYYQSIFASSDGMILDSGSFNAEYQYTHKPLLFLTRDTQQFTDIGAELMKVLYHADGRDHKAIAAFIENVLIKKRDSMADARRKFFDEHLNYQKDNGMLAGEFIFKTIDRELNGGV